MSQHTFTNPSAASSHLFLGGEGDARLLVAPYSLVTSRVICSWPCKHKAVTGMEGEQTKVQQQQHSAKKSVLLTAGLKPSETLVR